MSIIDLFRTALRSLATNLLRATLTMLGVVIGVASVIAVLALGNGARAAVEASFQFLGANQIQIAQHYDMQNDKVQPIGQKLTYQDGLGLLDVVPLVERVDMTATRLSQVRYQRTSLDIYVTGVTADYLVDFASANNVQPTGWKAGKSLTPQVFLSEGRFFTTDEVLGNAPVCVLGKQTTLDLFLGDDPIGQTIWVDRMQCTVIGTLVDLESTTTTNQYLSDLYQVIMPVSTMIQSIFGEVPSLDLTVYIRDVNQMDEAKQMIVDYLRVQHSIQQDANGKYQDDFDITTRKDILGQAQNAARTFSILLAAIASISLVVGGIGIMNVMMVSVTERTREIGVRLAVGARRRDIISQFLLEAVLISVGGGLTGIVLGILTIPLVASFNGSVAILLPGSIPLAFGVSMLIGVVCGLYPALRASRLDPIEALRYE